MEKKIILIIGAQTVAMTQLAAQLADRSYHVETIVKTDRFSDGQTESIKRADLLLIGDDTFFIDGYLYSAKLKDRQIRGRYLFSAYNKETGKRYSLFLNMRDRELYLIRNRKVVAKYYASKKLYRRARDGL